MSQERLTKCPLCKSGLFLNHAELCDFSISKENFMLCKCTSCNLIFTNPRPDKISIGKYYESEDYISHHNKSTNIVNIIYKWVRNITLKKKVSWLNNYSHKKGSLLDIGCGTGEFLSLAKKNGWKISGIEPNKTARKIATKKKLSIQKNLEDIKKDQKFDIISLFHVLEHVHDLRKTGKKIISHLNDNGRVFIAVPNINSYDASSYGSFWAAWDVPRHLYHFSQETINAFAKEVGMEIVAQEPMVFDSYYVSLLSEKYLKPEINFLSKLINAYIKGYKSNAWSRKNNNDFSSILYILKKK
ncbi:methyltransferase domain-containing protein [Aquiflexum sp. TKW24L]|uniref:methyltransferase domain-containing protein n=1 Tax=Aquiflexum sp. TKW24L TaxID=2942212 RepID=UPI0020C16665|nr:methyltransferase domain-containing protein [Aquiflexum sp. TKW24L]MCL6258401.1 methyltransferase domain-containing protein [Aquiflexum sp. TKW24L]